MVSIECVNTNCGGSPTNQSRSLRPEHAHLFNVTSCDYQIVVRLMPQSAVPLATAPGVCHPEEVPANKDCRLSY